MEEQTQSIQPQGRLERLTTKGLRSVRGQAMVEYVLIAVLVSLAIAGVIAATGPTVGNIFSNTVYNLMNQTATPYNTLSQATIFGYANDINAFVPATLPYKTNTPSSPTCAPGGGTPTYAPTTTGGFPGTWIVALC